MPREQASRSLIPDTPKHRIFRFPSREQRTMTRQRNTMEEAARHRQQAAKLYQCGHHEESSHHAHLAYAQHLHAKQHAEEAAKAHMKNHLDDLH